MTLPASRPRQRPVTDAGAVKLNLSICEKTPLHRFVGWACIVAYFGGVHGYLTAHPEVWTAICAFFGTHSVRSVALPHPSRAKQGLISAVVAGVCRRHQPAHSPLHFRLQQPRPAGLVRLPIPLFRALQDGQRTVGVAERRPQGARRLLVAAALRMWHCLVQQHLCGGTAGLLVVAAAQESDRVGGMAVLDDGAMAGGRLPGD